MRILGFLILLSLISCSLDYNDDNVLIEKIPALEIQTPQYIQSGLTYTIRFKYPLYNGCYSFQNVEYNAVNDSTRVIIPYARVVQNQACTEMYGEGNYTFDFYPQQSRNYYFKFYVGKNQNGTDQYQQYILIHN